MRPPPRGEQRRRGHEKRARQRGDKRHGEPRRPEKPHAQRKNDDERHGGKDVDLALRPLRGQCRMKRRPAQIRSHGKVALLRDRIKRAHALEHVADERAVGRLEPVEYEQPVTAPVLFARGVAVADRPPVVVSRLEVREIISGQQVRILLHGDKRREETRGQRRRRVRRNGAELPRQQQRARLLGQQPAAARRECRERLGDRSRLHPRMRTHVIFERLGGLVERGEIRTFQQDAELSADVVRECAQHVLPRRVEQGVEIRLHAVTACARKRDDCGRDEGEERPPSDSGPSQFQDGRP